VIDPTGAVISGAQVTATGEVTANRYRVTTDSSGAFRFLAVPPGKYAVRFEMQGFKTQNKTSVVVNASHVTDLNVRLDVGDYPNWVTTPLTVDVLEPDSPPLGPYRFGAIAGQVTDRQGGSIPQVRITLIERTSGSRQETATDCSGLYRQFGLVPGSYTVRFEAKGFLARTKAKVRIKVDQLTQVDTKLKIAAHGGPEIEVPCEAQPTGTLSILHP
jgi:hypothetical protein